MLISQAVQAQVAQYPRGNDCQENGHIVSERWRQSKRTVQYCAHC
jgi:hypothetical protein